MNAAPASAGELKHTPTTAELVALSRTEQGLSERVEDPRVLEAIAAATSRGRP